MKFKMTVKKKEEVEIPDLPEDFVAFIYGYGAGLKICLDTPQSDTGEMYARLIVEAIAPQGLDEANEARFDTELGVVGERLPNVPDGFLNAYFISDCADGYEPCKAWLYAMALTHPYIEMKLVLNGIYLPRYVSKKKIGEFAPLLNVSDFHFPPG